MLSIRNLSKRFGASTPASRAIFENLDFHLARGEYLALMGESGAGKSTLLNIVAGLEPASSGEIILDGEVLDARNDDRITRFRRARLGFIFQAFHLLPYLTVFENIALPLRLNRWKEADITQRVNEMLEAVGLADKGAALPRELSGGEMQRVAIARALAHRPALLLADEPTGNLDPDTAQQILDLLRNEIRRNGATAILVTHSGIAARSADRAVMLTRQGIVPHAA
ncbi:MAG TPA: ABC transporter ATP-binding protein [Usitatibacteraceae bacterium]